MTGEVHACRYRQRLIWSPWERTGPLRERTARRTPVCEVCGGEQPARRPRPPVRREVEAAAPSPISLLDDAGRTVVLAVAVRAGREDLVPARGLLGALAARGLVGSVAEPCLEQLMRSGLVRLSWTLSPRRGLHSVTVLDRTALEELGRPGERAARGAAVAAAREQLAGIDHPVAGDVERVLSEEAETISPELALALAAVARHAAEGEVLAERVFSTRHLGSSKALARLRDSIEQRLGPLGALGIREGAALTLLGGAGRVVLARGATLDLAAAPPFMGLSRESAMTISRLELPSAGLVAVENLTVFDACCRGEVSELAGAMFVWTAGYPGRGVRAAIEAAARVGGGVTAWCDLDLDGVRIARIVASWAGGCVCRFHRMGAEEVRTASRKLSLGQRARRAIAREIREGPDDALRATLLAMREEDVWVEQEALLAGRHGA